MDYLVAQKIFEHIRDRPYRVATDPHTPADNCYFKSIELIKELTGYGYTLRARLGEIDWRDLPFLPDNIMAHYEHHTNTAHTHFYPEIYIDNEWRILDPSWNKAFAENYDLPFSVFGEENQSCFKITKLYSHEEQIHYVSNWMNDAQKTKEFFSHTKEFFQHVNDWLKRNNP